METQNALVMVFERNSFYRRQMHLALAAFLFTLIVIVFLFATIIYLLRTPTEPLYFATDEVGRLIQIIPPSQPNMSKDEVIAWTIEGVQKALSMDYVNYIAEGQEAQKYFTTYGWKNYLKSMTDSGNIIGLTTRKMIVKAQVVGLPTLTKEGILGGAYAWKFDMPVLMTYMLPPYDEKSIFSNPLTVSVIVQRQPALQGYKDLGIVQIIGNFANTQAAPIQGITAPTS